MPSKRSDCNFDFRFQPCYTGICLEQQTTEFLAALSKIEAVTKAADVPW
jgi:hypothetical protein